VNRIYFYDFEDDNIQVNINFDGLYTITVKKCESVDDIKNSMKRFFDVQKYLLDINLDDGRNK